MSKTLFDDLRKQFNDPNGRWLTVGDQVDVLNLVDVAEAAQAVVRGSAGDGTIAVLNDALRRLDRRSRSGNPEPAPPHEDPPAVCRPCCEECQP